MHSYRSSSGHVTRCLWMWSDGSTGKTRGGRQSCRRRKRKRVKNKCIEVREWGDKCWLDEMGGDAAPLLSSTFLRSLEWTETRKSELKKKKKGLRGDTPISPYPISRCDGVDDLMIRGQPINSELARWGEVELCVCDPHSLLFHYLCEMDYHTQLCCWVRGWVCVMWLCPKPVNWDKWLCHWNIHCVMMLHP